MGERNTSEKYDGSEVAIIGFTGRFPGARDVEQFWSNLRDGIESVILLSEQELIEAGVDPALVGRSNHVRAEATLSDIDLFDASFFGYSPREAQVMDPQHRLFLECAWEALEEAGYNPEIYPGLIGVYAGSGGPSYLLNNISVNPEVLQSISGDQIWMGNGVDFLATRVSYKLNLRGPSYVIQTGCSTSLAAIHVACQNILGGECDMALAGGVLINSEQGQGYLYREGGIASPDGHCRAFDASAQGTVGGNGVGIVVLKRLDDALADGDTVHAIIKGSASNNDGSLKIGYTAPSVEGQAKVIAEALAMADVEPESITYVEAHGTATPLGDPIEIAALTKAFHAGTTGKRFCAIGSVKTNIGHLDAAAGIAGLIKTVLALKHKQIPPSLHFQQPNPKIDFENSPFYVNTALAEWGAGEQPRRAGVSSFGIGGTNVHLILEEAPEAEASGGGRPWQLVTLAARSGAALEAASANLAAHLKQHPEINMADAAYTTQVGRKAFDYRRVVVCRDAGDGSKSLETGDAQQVFTSQRGPAVRPLVFMFPGQGSQYPGMAAGLYESEAFFRKQIDHCAELLKPQLGLDLREVLFPSAEKSEEAARQLAQTNLTQPTLFVIEYALARLLMHWGQKPEAMLGHSLGEYVAACLAEVFTLEEALALIAERGRLIQALPAGAMLSVALSEQEVRGMLGSDLSVASVNAPRLCVVSGLSQDVEVFARQLDAKGAAYQRLHTSHAFHSEMMTPILAQFTESVRRVKLRPFKIPFISNVTGTWITNAEATSPAYWTQHLRQTVQFAAGLQELSKNPERILLEVGPGATLRTLAKQCPDSAADRLSLGTLRRAQDASSDVAFLLETLGKLWLDGARINWEGFHEGERRQRIRLPTYPFERQRYWVEPSRQATAPPPALQTTILRKPDIADWFYLPAWRRTGSPALYNPGEGLKQQTNWLLFVDDSPLCGELVARLVGEGQRVVTVRAGDRFARIDEHQFTVNVQEPNDYELLLRALQEQSLVPKHILHGWNVGPAGHDEAESPAQSLFLGFYSLLFLARAFGKVCPTEKTRLCAVTTALHDVTGDEALLPERAMLLGACRVIPQENPYIRCQNIDLLDSDVTGPRRGQLVENILAGLTAPTLDPVVAFRRNHRWLETQEASPLEATTGIPKHLKHGGVYLLTGGLGKVGSALAEYLAREVRAKLILTGLSELPEREGRNQWLSTHDESDEVSRRLRSLKVFEELGAEVLYVAADVAVPEQVGEVLAQARARFGEIDGVIHAAGVSAAKIQQPVESTNPLECAQVFRAKVDGLRTLHGVLQASRLDFFICFSSLSSVLGGLGHAPYSAANLFMDTFAAQQPQAFGCGVTSINWDGWRFNEQSQNDGASKSDFGELSISPADGVDVMRRVLASNNISQIIVSTGDLQARVDKWIKLESLADTALAATTTPTALYARPTLKNTYVAPRSELEQHIARIWQRILGIEQVGVFDNFFDLGGHSLLAVQLISHLRSEFQIEVSLHRLFECPTVDGLARTIELEQANQKVRNPFTEKIKPRHYKTIEQLMAEIDQPSESAI